MTMLSDFPTKVNLCLDYYTIVIYFAHRIYSSTYMEEKIRINHFILLFMSLLPGGKHPISNQHVQ